MTQKKKQAVKKAGKRSSSKSRSDGDFHLFIADQIRYLRDQRRYSQQELADRANVDQAQISQLENHRTSPKMSTFFKIVKALEVAPAEFFEGFRYRGTKTGKKALDPVAVVAQEISTRIYAKTKHDEAVEHLWNRYVDSGGKDDESLANMLIRVFFDQQAWTNMDHINELPEYQRLLLGELAGELLKKSKKGKAESAENPSRKKMPKLRRLKRVAL